MAASPEPADEGLVAAAQRGDLTAFNSLVARYQTPLFNLCLRMLGDRQAAEDATQEAFLSAHRALPRFAGGSLRNWLTRIAANQCKDELRRRRRRGTTSSLDRIVDTDEGSLEIPDEAPTAPELAERAELGRQLQLALDVLPADQREAIVLVDLHEFRYGEAARVAGVSVGTVKSRVHRGRRRLRAYLRAHPELIAGYRRLEE